MTSQVPYIITKYIRDPLLVNDLKIICLVIPTETTYVHIDMDTLTHKRSYAMVFCSR
ncbi:MAG: hypothetical protein QGF78_02390 [Candidatus Bathyarchaeota archaeon]|nr:hypothetical protein [Candidatus Bathyarchaeota archaeon]